MTQNVQDKKAEFGISLSIVIQGLILASMIGFGDYIVDGLADLNISIKELTTELAILNTATSLNSNDINHNSADIKKLRGDLDEHIQNYPHYIGNK